MSLLLNSLHSPHPTQQNLKRKMKNYEVDKKHLLEFVKSCQHHLNIMDGIMTKPESLERGKSIATEINRFNYSLDVFMHIGMGLSFDKMKKVLNKSFSL